MPTVFIRCGLFGSRGGRHQMAEAWLLDLLADSTTSGTTATALAQELTKVMESRQPDLAKAWSLSRCLARGGFHSTKHIGKALVQGGLSDPLGLVDLLGDLHKIGSLEGDLGKEVAHELWEDLVKEPGQQERQNYRSQTERFTSTLRCLHTISPSSIAEAASAAEQGARRLAILKTLLRDSEGAAGSLRDEIMQLLEQAGMLHGLLVRLLQSEDREVAGAAATELINRGELKHFALPMALLRGGLEHHRREINSLLDSINAQAAMELPLRIALEEALRATKDPEAQWVAALYMMDHGEASHPGVARALVSAGFSHRWHAPRANAIRRLRYLLSNPDTRDATVASLGTCLFDAEDFHMHRSAPGSIRLNFIVAILLLSTGVSLSELLVLAVDADPWNAPQALALVALSGRIDEMITIAERLGLSQFPTSETSPSKVSSLGS